MTTERGHAIHLAPLARAVLADAGIAATDLDSVVATVGPGSFTGLRVGLALAQGIALGGGVPAWGISSFLVHAAAAASRRAEGAPLVVALDSRREELFFQVFGAGAEEPFTASPAEAARRLISRFGVGVSAGLSGDAAPLLADALSAAGGSPTILHTGPADGAVVAAAAAKCIGAGEMLLPPRPLYLRSPDVTLAVAAVPP